MNLSANYSFTDGKVFTKNEAGKDTSYNNLYRRPKSVVNLNAGYQYNKNWFVSAHLKTVSKFYEPKYADNPYTMSGYYTLDIYSEYKICKQAKVFAGFQNITDQQYFDIRGFTSKRFNFDLGCNIDL